MGSSRLLVLAALAALSPVPAGAEALLARYEVRAAGLRVMEVEVRFELDGSRYRLRVHTRNTGLAGMLTQSEQVTVAEGAWRGAEPVPARYRAEGQGRSGPRRTALDWPTPTRPVLRALEPPIEPDREPVPEGLRANTVDALSALAKLTRTVARTGRCDASAAVYDGRRRADYTARTEGVQDLPRDGLHAGPALRCAFESRLLAGQRSEREADWARKPQQATAWLARPLPGREAIPVRIEMPSRWFGTIRAVLAEVTPLPSGQDVAEKRD
ncbi:DUF3108 domain-containing protein [Roseicella aquatilis]|uniref:DUF3108 domain-containing protein n=1 Tax=Roseicella aquatilis TaxID=2527868 RepID=A0A4R4D611_9PROT|nr:DUF3108 domain-containing protein [Roseicella aquatilis]TCZ53944.1 DUF3108 domain-containing protein [Roseicella aquatilis]